MRKKKQILTEEEAAWYILNRMIDKWFGGTTPSDRNSDWLWGLMKNERCTDQYTMRGVWLQFKDECYCMSVIEAGLEYVRDQQEIHGYKIAD